MFSFLGFKKVTYFKYMKVYVPAVLAALILICISFYIKSQYSGYKKTLSILESDNSILRQSLNKVQVELEEVKSEEDYLKNKNLYQEIEVIQKTYDQAVDSYENLLKLKEISNKTADLDKQFILILDLLSKRQPATAAAEIKKLNSDITKAKDAVTASFVIPVNVVQSNTPPSGGYSQQKVKSDAGEFLVDIVSADLSSTRVIVDSASESDCRDDCPVMALGEYVSRNGGFAGINGSYFCPATYPSCSDKKNSFDTLLMNKNKNYLNSDNNVYSTVPAVIFLGSSVRFVGQSLEWGRDTGVDGVLANQPLLLSGGNITFGGDSDPKKGSRGSRSFVANKGNTVYIGVVRNATVVEVAYALKALGLENALNLDSGGSTALYYNGYKVGPGRNIPNAIVLIRR